MIIITGASKGLGKAIAENLIKKDKKVLGLSRTNDNSDFDILKCDISNYESIKEVCKYIKNKKFSIEAIINAAGIASMNLALTTSKKSTEQIINTNLLGTIYSCQLFTPFLIRRGSGSIINFSTIAVKLALKGESIYSASKSGIETFSRCFAREVSDFKIRVNCIAPGPIKTDLLRGISDDKIANILKQQVTQKQFEISDVCNIVEVLLDEKSESINGQIIRIGGA